MRINEKKTTTMIFNFTQKYQFTTRLNLNGKHVKVVPEAKLLGTIIQNDLKWDSNTSRLVKRANARMQLLHKLYEFGATREDMREIYISYIRSILEQNSVVWHSSLTEENIQDLERIRKSACKIIMKNNNIEYIKSLQILNLESLSDRRQILFENFAYKSFRSETIYFETNNKTHVMQTRHPEAFQVTHCNTQRLKDSAIPQMQELLNQMDKNVF